MKMKDIAEALSAQLVGDGTISVDRIVHPDDADRPSDLAIAMTADAAVALANTRLRPLSSRPNALSLPDASKPQFSSSTRGWCSPP
jgi:hypothetical protein